MKEAKKEGKKLLIVSIILGAIVIIAGTYLTIYTLFKHNDKEEIKSNITPLLYEVTKDGSNNKMYLFGSIHVANNEDLIFPKYIMDAYNSSHYLACEFDLVKYLSDSEKMMEDAVKMLYQDNTTIKDHLTEEAYNKLIDFLTRKKAYVNAYEYYKPYFFLSLFTNMISSEAKYNSALGVDGYFINKAYDDKKNILEVESYSYQTSILEEFPDEFYELLLISEIDEYDKAVEETKNLYNAWKKGDANGMLLYGSEDMQIEDDFTEKEKQYIVDFNNKLIDERNKGMLNKAIEYFNNNQDVFFMVGSLHIIGDKGLAKGLKDNGFNVRQIVSD